MISFKYSLVLLRYSSIDSVLFLSLLLSYSLQLLYHKLPNLTGLQQFYFSWSLHSFFLWFSSRTEQVPPPITVNTFLFLFVCSFFCFLDGYVTTSLCDCLVEVSVDGILSQVYNDAHINTYIHTCILTYKHTNRLT